MNETEGGDRADTADSEAPARGGTVDDESVESARSTGLTIEEAASILGEETRARILVELGEQTRRDGVSPMALSFSALMDRVGVEDSGRFNYHLEKLVGSYVQRVEDENWLETSDARHGYMLSTPGWLVYRALVTGTLSGETDPEPFDAGDCPDCDGELVAAYHPDHCLFVSCDECESLVHYVHLSDRAFEGRSDEEVLEASIRKDRHGLGSLQRGVCYGCGSAVDRTLWTELPDMWNVLREHDVYATLICSGCGEGFVGHPVVVASATLPVAGFFHEHGRDARAEPNWVGPLARARDRTTVHQADPIGVSIPFELGDERLTVRLDDELRVVETNRSRA